MAPAIPGLSFRFVHESVRPDGTPCRSKTASGTAFYSRAFCRDECNSGWMADLEDAVKPILEPMLHQRSWTTFTAEDQRLLAFWVTKTVLAFQTQEAGSHTCWARPEDFRAVYEGRGPLPASQIWVGAREHHHAAFHRGHSLRIGQDDDARVDGFGAVLSVGYAVFWMLVPFSGPLGLRLNREAAMVLKPLWPGLRRPISWPPHRTIEPVDLTGLPQWAIRRSRTAGALSTR